MTMEEVVEVLFWVWSRETNQGENDWASACLISQADDFRARHKIPDGADVPPELWERICAEMRGYTAPPLGTWPSGW